MMMIIIIIMLLVWRKFVLAANAVEQTIGLYYWFVYSNRVTLARLAPLLEYHWVFLTGPISLCVDSFVFMCE